MAKGFWLAPVIGLSLLARETPAQPASVPDTYDDLYRINSKRFAEAYIFRGADFQRYDKIMLDPPEVAFRPDWLRQYNLAQKDHKRRLSDDEAAQIVIATQMGLSKIYAGAFERAGFSVTTNAAPDVLKVRVRIINLTIDAPKPSASARSFSREAGRAKLIVEIRDAMTGAVLGRAIDARGIGEGPLGPRTTETNRADFGEAFTRWSDLSAEAVAELTKKKLRP